MNLEAVDEELSSPARGKCLERVVCDADFLLRMSLPFVFQISTYEIISTIQWHAVPKVFLQALLRGRELVQ